MKHKHLIELLSHLKNIGVGQFATPDFQVSFNCPHERQDSHSGEPIGFQVREDDDEEDASE